MCAFVLCVFVCAFEQDLRADHARVDSDICVRVCACVEIYSYVILDTWCRLRELILDTWCRLRECLWCVFRSFCISGQLGELGVKTGREWGFKNAYKVGDNYRILIYEWWYNIERRPNFGHETKIIGRIGSDWARG